MANKLTVKQVAALQKKDAAYKVAVDTGLLLRVAPSGVKSWIVTYTVKQQIDEAGNPIESPHCVGRQREYVLPKAWGESTDGAHLSLADAKGEAANIRALAREGIDFQVQQSQIRQAEAQARVDEKADADEKRAVEQVENLTVKDLFATWMADGVRRKDGNAELQRSFDRDVLPEIGNIAIKQVTEHDLRKLLRKMVDRGVNRLAVLTCGNLTQMFLWAEKRQPWRKLLTEGNPVQLIEIEKIVSPDYDISNERDRRLSSEEILELHNKFRAMRIEYDNASDRRVASRPVEKTTELAIWIMLSTICRVGELSMSRWEHVNLKISEWFIPRQNTKGSIGNQSDLTVYLSQLALDQFRQLHEVTGDSEWCFPAKNKDGHVCVKSMSKQVGDRQAMFKKGRDGNPRQPMKNRRHDNSLMLGEGKNGEWTPHDLRRTGATMMQSLGVSLEIIDRCQNHVLPGSKTRRHYLHHDYAEEKREAWRQLGERLSLLVNPAENVVILRRLP
jgi:integrase